MSNIIKGPTRGYAARIAMARRDALPKEASFSRAPVILATPQTYGAVLDHGGQTYALEETAIAASKSMHVEDQRTAIILANMTVIGYAVEGGASAEVCWLALQGARINQEVFDGDQSDPLIPPSSGANRAKTAYFRMTAHVMVVIRMLAALEGISVEQAAMNATAWFDHQLNSQLGVRIWQVSFKVECKNGSPSAEPAREADGIAGVARKLLGYMKAEEAATRTDKAMPADSEGAAFYATGCKIIEKCGADKNLFERIRSDAYREMVVLTPAAQAAVVSRAPQPEPNQNTPPAFANRHAVTCEARKSATDLAEL